jgi:hypothetical protein
MTKNTNSKRRATIEYTSYLVSDIEILNLLFIWPNFKTRWCLCFGALP